MLARTATHDPPPGAFQRLRRSTARPASGGTVHPASLRRTGLPLPATSWGSPACPDLATALAAIRSLDDLSLMARLAGQQPRREPVATAWQGPAGFRWVAPLAGAPREPLALAAPLARALDGQAAGRRFFETFRGSLDGRRGPRDD